MPILDVDETVVSNIDFQLTFERPFENWKLDEWTRNTAATPIHGVKEFVEAARAAGVTVFFVTNRPCEPIDGIDDPCPQRQSTIDDISEVGIETDADLVFLSATSCPACGRNPTPPARTARRRPTA
jgi:acid phosphatase